MTTLFLRIAGLAADISHTHGLTRCGLLDVSMARVKNLLKKAYQDSEDSGKHYEAYVNLVKTLEGWE